MKIVIDFTIKDVERILAEHCRRQFKIDPRSVSLESAEPGGEMIYFAKVEGEYQPGENIFA